MTVTNWVEVDVEKCTARNKTSWPRSGFQMPQISLQRGPWTWLGRTCPSCTDCKAGSSGNVRLELVWHNTHVMSTSTGRLIPMQAVNHSITSSIDAQKCPSIDLFALISLSYLLVDPFLTSHQSIPTNSTPCTNTTQRQHTTNLRSCQRTPKMSSTRALRLTPLASHPSLSTTYRARAQAQLARPASLFQARHYAAKGEGEKDDLGGPGGQEPTDPEARAQQNA